MGESYAHRDSKGDIDQVEHVDEIHDRSRFRDPVAIAPFEYRPPVKNFLFSTIPRLNLLLLQADHVC